MKNRLDVEFNKKNRVIVAQFASNEAIANTPHSPQLNKTIPQEDESVKVDVYDYIAIKRIVMGTLKPTK